MSRVTCQAVYTAGVVLPKPVGTCRYWHRSINPKKLIEVKFSHLSRWVRVVIVIMMFNCNHCSGT